MLNCSELSIATVAIGIPDHISTTARCTMTPTSVHRHTILHHKPDWTGHSEQKNPATESQNALLEFKIQFATESSHLELLYSHHSGVFALEVLNPGWAFRSSRIFFNAATFELTKRRGRAPAPGVCPVDFDKGTSGASVVSAKDGNNDAGTASASGGTAR
jgi:hypothetical protein